jgi:hypothetical protein
LLMTYCRTPLCPRCASSLGCGPRGYKSSVTG